ncbi:N-acetylmuramidase domain-containing protein [Luteimonas yindakuii]|uniref:N-acetylmuramidase domain-containing protein n=1 Tax=Luteimonas yindakuii TaxID=2565782 RepID=UPI001420C8A6
MPETCAPRKRNNPKAFVSFIESDRRLSTSIINKDWLSFTRTYNGPAQNGCDAKMESNYNALISERR